MQKFGSGYKKECLFSSPIRLESPLRKIFNQEVESNGHLSGTTTAKGLKCSNISVADPNPGWIRIQDKQWPTKKRR
jgi:hypothetical protein